LTASIEVIQALDSPEWNADFYGALSSISRLAAAVKNKANVLRVAYNISNLNRSLKTLFDRADAAMNGRLDRRTFGEIPTPRRLMDAAEKLMKAARDLAYLYELLRRVGLTNNSLTAGNLRRVWAYREQLEDLADWFELMAQSDEVKAIFERASREKERGEIFDLERV
jgi:hypothetical protein